MVATGQFVVDGKVKKVQLQTGGIVGELKVCDGDKVERGQLLIRLDDTVTRSNLQIFIKQLDDFAARDGQKAQLHKRAGLLRDAIAGLSVRQDAGDR